MLVIGIMAAHAVGEGSGVGVAYSGNRGWSQGILVTLAIGLHNIPEGLAVATVMVSRGVSAKQATMWAVLTALPQALVKCNWTEWDCAHSAPLFCFSSS